MVASVVRQDPFKNISADQEIDFTQPKFTRSMAHRCLNNARVDHDVNWGLEELLKTMQRNEVPFEFLPPGNKSPKIKKGKAVEKNSPEISDLLRQIAELTKKVEGLAKAEVIEPPVDNNPKIKFSKDGFPTSRFVLRKWCREKNIETHNTDIRSELISKLKKQAQ